MLRLERLTNQRKHTTGSDVKKTVEVDRSSLNEDDGSELHLLELYKVNEISEKVEESDVFVDIPYDKGQFNKSRGKLVNDLEDVQAFIDLSEHGDTLLVRRRDQKTNAVLKAERFELRRASSVEIGLAKDRYQERYGVDYDFPRRQMGRTINSLATVHNDFLMGSDVYDKDFDELLKQFYPSKLQEAVQRSVSSEASPREYNDKTKFAFPISSTKRFKDRSAEDQTRGTIARELKEKDMQRPQDTSAKVYSDNSTPTSVSGQSDDDQAKPRRWQLERLPKSESSTVSQNQNKRYASSSHLDNGPSRKKGRHVMIDGAAPPPSKGLKRPLTPYPLESKLPTKKPRMDSPSSLTGLKGSLLSILDQMHRIFELDQKTSNLISDLVEEITTSE